MLTDAGRTPDARVTGILLAHLGAFVSGELKSKICRSTDLPASFLDELNGNTDSLHQEDKDENKNEQKCG